MSHIEKFLKFWLASFKILFNYLKTERIIFFVVFLFFVLGISLGFVLPSDTKLALIDTLMDKFSEMDYTDSFSLFRVILENNLFVEVQTVVGGLIVLPPIFILLINGLSLGIFTDMISRLTEFMPSMGYYYLAAIIPHGIIEIPFMVITSFVGVLAGLKIFLGKRIIPSLNRRGVLKSVARIFFFCLVPAAIAAALIEGYVTPVVIQKILESKGEFQYSQIDNNLSKYVIDSEFLSKLGVDMEEIDYNMYQDEVANKKYLSNYTVLIRTVYDPELMKKIENAARPQKTFERYFRGEDGRSVAFIYLASFESTDAAKDYLNTQKEIEARLVEKYKSGESMTQFGYSDDTAMLTVEREGMQQLIREVFQKDRYVWIMSYSGHPNYYNSLIYGQMSKINSEVDNLE